jgi:hypothetical protein
MKYADAALNGKAGKLWHLKDMDSLIANKVRYANMVQAIEKKFNQLDQLGLKFNKGQGFTKVTLDPTERPEVIFILANHNPRASRLKKYSAPL